MSEHCQTCAKSGVVRKAERKMPDGRLLCDDHYRAESGLPKKWCAGCLEQGKHVRATVRLNDLDLCDDHSKSASIKDGPPVALKPHDVEVRKHMALDKVKAQEMRDAGTPVKEIAKHFGVSDACIYMNTTKPGKAKQKRRSLADRAVGVEIREPVGGKKLKHTKSVKNGFFDVIQTLKGKREEYQAQIEKIDRIIADLAEL